MSKEETHLYAQNEAWYHPWNLIIILPQKSFEVSFNNILFNMSTGHMPGIIKLLKAEKSSQLNTIS